MKLKINIFIPFLFFAIFSCHSGNEARNQSEAAAWYKFEFGKSPSADVSNINAKQVVVRDSAMAWLQFNADKKTFDELLLRGFAPATYTDFVEQTKGGNVPGWWNINDRMSFYEIEGWSKNYANSTGFLGYDKNNGMIYFCHSGID